MSIIERPGGGKPIHFGAYTLDEIVVSQDPANPSYVTGLNLFPTASTGILIADVNTGLFYNDTGKILTMQGSLTFQVEQGLGTKGNLLLWSERSPDAINFTENDLSLRTIEVGNDIATAHTKSAAISEWLPGTYNRFAMYNAGLGAITIKAPVASVNEGNSVTGMAWYFQVNEV